MPASMSWLESLKAVSSQAKYCIPPNFKKLAYGTAGFRDKGNVLDHVVFRMGVLAALRSFHVRKAVGIMITASHNPREDNGVKIVDPSGEMLEADWEYWATGMANAEDVLDYANKLIDYFQIDLTIPRTTFPLVVIGRDTRETSLDLRNAAYAGIREAMQVPVIGNFHTILGFLPFTLYFKTAELSPPLNCTMLCKNLTLIWLKIILKWT